MPELIATIDAILLPHAGVLGGDYHAYRNHACRVALTQQQLDPADGETASMRAVAAAHHDLGIWVAHTFDYVEPSVRLACEYLESIRQPGWSTEVAAMIRNHHKLTRCDRATPPSAETFRRADWIDVSAGLVRFGLPREAAAQLRRELPNRGFHRRLLKLTVRRAVSHPLSPLPMLRW